MFIKTFGRVEIHALGALFSFMYEVIDVAVVKPHSIVQYKNQHSQRNTMKISIQSQAKQ